MEQVSSTNAAKYFFNNRYFKLRIYFIFNPASLQL